MADTGNPNVYTTFQGRHSVTVPTGVTTTNAYIMLSNVNDVQFMGNYEVTDYVAGDTLLTLPPECRPTKDIAFICVVGNTTTEAMDIAKVGIDGTVKLQSSNAGTATVWLRGTNFNISDNFY